MLFILAALCLQETKALVDAECPSGSVNCTINRPHYLYDSMNVLSASGTLYLNNVLHCTQYLATLSITASVVTIDLSAHITCATVLISAQQAYVYGVINTDGRGYGSDQGVGPGSIPESLYDGAIGGGYDGPGRTRCHGSSFGSAVQFGFGSYGDANEEISNFQFHVGSGGGQGITSMVAGGRGGGAVNVSATNILVMDGRITANGQDGSPGIDGSCDGGGGGSGGSIILSAAQINGSGELIAVGGRGGLTFDTRVSGVTVSAGCTSGKLYGTPGGNGEGGRVIIQTQTVRHAIRMSVKGGVQREWACVDGGDGQVFYTTTRYLGASSAERSG